MSLQTSEEGVLGEQQRREINQPALETEHSARRARLHVCSSQERLLCQARHHRSSQSVACAAGWRSKRCLLATPGLRG